jgi:REP element-mobilizing transposase RayT
MGCDVLAVGGVADHVHLAVRVPATLDIPKLMQQVKGVSSAFARDVFGPDRFFRWQDGYGVFSFHALQAERVIAYIERQQQRHAENRLWSEWEDPDEEPPSA